MNTIRRHCAFTLVELFIVVAIMAILAAILSPTVARAQSPPSLNTTNGTTAGFLANVQTIFGLYNTNLDFYGTDTNQFGLKTGLDYSSADPGLKQMFEPNFFHRIGGDTNASEWLGAGIDLETLGTGQSAGNALDGFGVHGYFKYASHNIAGNFGLGYHSDQDINRNDIEAGFGAEAYFQKNIGIWTQFWTGVDPNTSTGVKGAPSKAQVDTRIDVGATWKF